MEKGSAESTIRNAINKDENSADIVLKPAPKPVLSATPPPWTPNKFPKDDRPEREMAPEVREKVVESLGEVLEKAEKLESASSSARVNGNNSSSNNQSRIGGDSSESQRNSSLRKSKTLKSVWRKGSPTANVEKVVKAAPPPPPQAQAPLRSPSPIPSPPNLQAKPVAAAAPVAPKKTAAERSPILVDKFASKKPVVDPIIEQAVLSVPMKPGKGPAAKMKDERRRKSGTAGGLRRRLVANGDNPAEDASELNVSIPGASGKRTGRKWSKASRKAAKLKALAASAPVKVDILEVGEEGMMIEELAYNLAIGEAEILSYLFAKGVNPDAASTLNKDMVKMICREYEVEVIEAEEIKVEQMARKRDVLDEEDLDSLEVRPPVITIMGHVDHGKVCFFKVYHKFSVADLVFLALSDDFAGLY